MIESLFWMELLVENDLRASARLTALMKGGDELLAMVVAAAKSTRAGSASRA